MWNAFDQFDLADFDFEDAAGDMLDDPWNIRDLAPRWDLTHGTRVESWAAYADQCSEAFFNASEQVDPEAEDFDRRAILSAAAHIWDSTRGDPAWARFEVDAWAAELALLDAGDSIFCNAAMTLLGFFEFLADGDVVALSDVQDIVHTLAIYATAAWRRGRPPMRFTA